MEERTAVELVKLGMGTSATARACKGGWSITMGFSPDGSLRRGISQFVQLQRTRGGPRVFKTLEALVACAARIGFPFVTVSSSEIHQRPAHSPDLPPVKVTRQQAEAVKRTKAKKSWRR